MASPIGDMIVKLDMDNTEFNKGVSGARRNMKQISSEMKANMSQYSKSGNELNRLGTRIDGLKKKQKAQSQIVRESRKRYEELSKQYGDNNAKTQRAASELNKEISVMNDMDNELSDLNGQFEELSTQQRIANSRWTKMGNKIESAGGKMKSAGSRMSGVGKTLNKSVTLPLVGVGTAAVTAAKKTADHADEVLTMSKQVGAGAEEYQELNYALTRMGLKEADTEKALGRLNTRMGKAVSGSDKYKDALEDAGISQEDLEDGTYSTDEAFMKIIESLQNVESKQERASKASEIFGTRMSRKLMPAIEGGKDELENLRKEAKDTGNVMSGKALKDSQEFKDAMDKLQERGAGLVHELGAKLAPVLTDKLIPAIENKVIPALETGTDRLVDMIEWYSNLNDSTKTTIKRFGAFAVAAGPVLTITGKLTTGLGGVVGVVGKLTKSIGVVSGGGAAGAIAKLGKGGVVGLAIGGVAALATGIHKLSQNTKESKEINLDNAKSLSDQASELEKSKNQFEKLSNKADISNDKLAEMNDLNKKISESSNPGEIKQLKDRYDELAEKSGLSKDEIKKLFKANGNIIEQAPDVQTSVGDTGEKFVENTEKVNDYIDSLREMSKRELEDELKIAEENAEDALKRKKELKQDLNDLDEKSAKLRQLESLSEEERNQKISEWHQKIEQQLADKSISQDEFNELKKEEEIVEGFINNGIGEGLEKIQQQREETHKKIDSQQQEIDKVNEVKKSQAEVLLQEIGINKEAKKGVKHLSDSIRKNHVKIGKLETEKRQTGELSEKDQQRLNKLRETTKEQEKTRQKIFKKTGLYGHLNSLVDSQLDKLSAEKKKRIENLLETTNIKYQEGNILGKIDDQNSSIDDKIQKLKQTKTEDGKITQENQNQIDKLKGQKKKNDIIKRQILKAIGFKQDEIDKIVGAKDASEDQGDQIYDNNQKTRTGIKLEEDRTAEARKDVDKNVDVLPTPTLLDFNNKIKQHQDKSVGIDKSSALANLDRDVSKGVNKTVNLSAKPDNTELAFPLLGYARGTKGHPYNGPAVVGDGKGSNAGRELVTPPKGNSFLSPPNDTLMNLPKGTHVTPARETKKMFPQYADGTGVDGKFIFKKLGIMGLGNTLIGGGVGDSFAKVTNGAIDVMQKMLDTGNRALNMSAPSGSGSASSWKPVIKKAAAMMNAHPSRSEISGIVSQIALESGGNQKTVQDPSVYDINIAQGNPARGLLQYIPDTFNQYKVPGHNNIYSGFDQLLAFFNNKNWRHDLPYGNSGWGPSGATKYANGGISVKEKMAHISEGNKPEAIVPLDKAKRGQALDVLARVADKFGVKPQTTVVNNADNQGVEEKLDKLINVVNGFVEKAGLSTVYTTVVNEMDSRELSRQTYKHDIDFQNKDEIRKSRGRGDF